MALSPGIPTSFVPKQPVQPARNRPMSSGTNMFLVVTVIIAVLSLVAAGATFAYEKLLQHNLAAKQAQLAEAQSRVDENSVEEFVRLRDRLSNGKDLLTNHILTSQFLDSLETVTLQNVRFDTLKLSVAGDRTAKLTMTGSAKNFNALAAQSNTFAAEKRIKRAIFSDITVTTDGLVGFSLSADIDPKLIIQGNTPTSAAVQPTTPSVPAPGTTSPATLLPRAAAPTTPAPSQAGTVATGTRPSTNI